MRKFSPPSRIEYPLTAPRSAKRSTPSSCSKLKRRRVAHQRNGQSTSRTSQVSTNSRLGNVAEGEVGKFDCHFIITDDDLEAIAKRTANPQMIFMQGKMKIKGNMGAAMKFTPDLIPEDIKF